MSMVSNALLGQEQLYSFWYQNIEYRRTGDKGFDTKKQSGITEQSRSGAQ
jgi:hypothetical protein